MAFVDKRRSEDSHEVFARHYTNNRGYPCIAALYAEGNASKLIIFVQRTDGDCKKVRYVSVLDAPLMDEVAKAWLAYREEDNR